VNYQSKIRDLPCVFCMKSGYGDVSWHHLRCLHQAGTGMKPPDWATIPVCVWCHEKCHSGEIPDHDQIDAMLETWLRIGLDELGLQRFFKEIGEAYWTIIQRRNST